MKRISMGLLALCFALSLVSCDSGFDYTPPTVTFAPVGSVGSNYGESTDTVTLPEPPATSSTPTKPDSSEELPVVSTLDEVSRLLNSSKEKNVFQVSFRYTGSESLDGATMARMTSCFYIYVSTDDDYYRVKMLEYVGDHVVDAYRRNDNLSLTAEERKVYDKAIAIVNEARANTKNDFELEVYLHDYLAETITYYSPSVDVPDPNEPPRHLTAAGGLLDGYANCQGYADSFYTLASIAGFTVSRMYVLDVNDGWHVVNTILLDGKYYIVDVTFDDVLYGEEDEVNYRLFNATEDMCFEYGWESYFEYYPIAEVLDEQYYYFYPENVQAYASLEAIASWIVSDWLEGKTEHRVMLYEGVETWEALSKELDSYLDATGRAYQYRIWAINSGEHTYYTVRFES